MKKKNADISHIKVKSVEDIFDFLHVINDNLKQICYDLQDISTTETSPFDVEDSILQINSSVEVLRDSIKSVITSEILREYANNKKENECTSAINNLIGILTNFTESLKKEIATKNKKK